MLRLSVFAISMLLVISSPAQKAGQGMIDSLLALQPVARDTNGAKIYHALGISYTMIDPAKASLYIDSGFVLSKKLNWEKGVAAFHVLRGNILNDAGNGDAAMTEYETALEISQRRNDLVTIAETMSDIGGVYNRKSDYTAATEWYLKALKVAEPTGNPNSIGTVLTNIATVYYNQQDHLKAIGYHRKALVQFEKLGEPDKLARTHNYLGNAYLNLGRTKDAETSYNHALAIYRSTNNRIGIAILLSQIAILFDPDYEKIIGYQLQSQAIWDSINPTHYNSIINLGNIGETYLNFIRADTSGKLSASQKAEYFTQAEKYLERAIQYSRETNDVDNRSYFSQVLAEGQELKGDYKSALANYKLGYGLRDSLYSQENKNKIAGMESKREIELRDAQLELNRLELASQRKLRIAMIGGIALLLLVAGLIYKQSLTRKKTNTTLLQLNNELDEANKVKARFFAILSHDLRSPVANLISFLELQQQQPGLFTASEAAAHQAKLTSSAHSLLETMEAMLLWSKGQMETFKPQVTSVPVNELFAYLRKFFNDVKGVDIRFADPGQLSVQTDQNYLQTIMNNLTANAVRVLQGREGAYIEWRAERQGEKVFLSITDNGPGLSVEQAKALQDEGALPNARTGFGLHLVRDLAKAIQCRINVKSEPGLGTTFTLSA